MTLGECIAAGRFYSGWPARPYRRHQLETLKRITRGKGRHRAYRTMLGFLLNNKTADMLLDESGQNVVQDLDEFNELRAEAKLAPLDLEFGA